MVHALPLTSKPKSGISMVHTYELVKIERFADRPGARFEVIVDGVYYHGNYEPAGHCQIAVFDMRTEIDTHAEFPHRFYGLRLVSEAYYALREGDHVA